MLEQTGAVTISAYPEDEGTSNTVSLMSPEDNSGDISPVSAKYAEERASKVAVAIGTQDYSPEDIKHKVKNNQTHELQVYAAAKGSMAAEARKERILQNWIAERAQKGLGAPTEAEVSLVRGLSQKEALASPEELSTILERRYAEELSNRTAANSKAYQEAEAQNDPSVIDRVDSALMGFERHVANNEIIVKELEEAKEAVKQQSWGEYIPEWTLNNLVPFYKWYKNHNLAAAAKASAVLPGENLQQQIDYLRSLQPSKLKSELARIKQYFLDPNNGQTDPYTNQPPGASNWQLWLDYVEALQTYGATQRVQANAGAILDTADLALTLGAGKVAIGAAKGAAKIVAKKAPAEVVEQALEDVAKESIKRNVKTEDMLVVVGQPADATLTQAAKIEATKGGPIDLEAVQKIADNGLMSILNPQKIVDDPASRLTAVEAKKLSESLEKTGRQLVDALDSYNPVARIDDGSAAFSRAVSEGVETFGKFHNVNPQNGIIDVVPVHQTKNGRNVNSIQIDLGRADRTLFETHEEAFYYAQTKYNFKKGDYSIEQKGNNFFLRTERDLNETAPTVRDVLVDTANKDVDSGNLGSSFFRALRNPDMFLSEATTEVRKIASNSGAAFQDAVQQAAKDLNKLFLTLPKSERRESGERLSRFISRMQDEDHPVTKVPGRYSNTIGEFQTDFLKHTGRMPSAFEAEMYFKWRQLMDFDYMLRNAQIYTSKARIGVMEHKFYLKETLEGPLKQTAAVEGRPLKGAPRLTKESHAVLIIDENGTRRLIEPLERGRKTNRTELTKLEEQGYKFIQVFDPLDENVRALSATLKNDRPFNFIAAKDVEQSRLSYRQLAYREGGHREYAATSYVKQPQIISGSNGRKYYVGDLTFSGHGIRGEAEAFAKTMETARQKMVAKAADFDSFVRNNLDMSPAAFKAQFGKGRPFREDMPFFSVERNNTWKNRHKDEYERSGLIDFTDSSFNMAHGTNVKFGQQRDEGLFNYSKTNSPVWSKKPAETLDPLGSINRNLGNLRDAAVFNDYKLRMAEQFIEQYADVLKASKEELRQAPGAHLMSPVWKETGVDQNKLAAAKQVHQSISLLVSNPSTVRNVWQASRDSLIDWVYKSNPKAAEYMDNSFIFRTRDPVGFLRAATFHSTLGMFNPNQLFLQAAAFNNMLAISPRHAAQSFPDVIAAMLLKYNDKEEIVKHLAKKGSKDFEEMFYELRKSGFNVVKGNHAYLDDISDPKVVSTKLGDALDFSTIFFRKGEEFQRTAAYAIAWREFKSSNPGVVVDDSVRRKILARADDLSMNMTNASNSNLQNTAGVLPLQMTSYVFRTMENFWTSMLQTPNAKFTRGEAVRLLGANMAMYGIPAGGGIALGFWPWYDQVEESAAARGIDLEKNGWTKLAMNGVYEAFFNWATSGDWNVASRYGPNGIPSIKDMIEGKSGAEAILGVSGSVLKRFWQNTAPFQYKLSSIFDAEGEDFKLTPSDFIEPLKTISSINAFDRAFVAMTFNQYLTKTGQVLQRDFEGVDAYGAMLLGLTPKEISTYYNRAKILSSQSQYIRNVTGLVQKEIAWAVRQETEEEAEVYFKRARALVAMAGTLSPKEKANIIPKVLEGLSDEQVAKINYRWATSGSVSRQEGRFDTLVREQRQAREKKESSN